MSISDEKELLEELEDTKRFVSPEDGKREFASLMPTIRKHLCEQWCACEQTKKFEDETALAMAIGDVLVTVLTSAPVITVSALMVKIGVKKLCDCP